MSDAFDVVVAGGGIAGLTAGLSAAGLGHRTMILIGGMLGGNLLSIECIEGYPGHPDGVAGYELCPALQGQAAAAGAEFDMTEVTALEPVGADWRVRTGAGDYQARSVILATGSDPRELGAPGEDRLRGKGVSHCASCDAPLLRGKSVAVIGGGDSALQEALTLAASASKVTIMTHGEALRAQLTFQQRAEAHPAIEFRFNISVEEILGDDIVTGVRVRDSAGGGVDDMAVAGVFVYIGMSPNTSFLDGLLALDATGRIPVDECMRSAMPGILAAGTVRAGAAGRAAASAEDGRIAAAAAGDYLAEGVWRDG